MDGVLNGLPSVVVHTLEERSSREYARPTFFLFWSHMALGAVGICWDFLFLVCVCVVYSSLLLAENV